MIMMLKIIIKSVQKYIQNKKTNVLPWPSQVPNSNPIENLWNELKKHKSKKTNKSATT